MYDSGRESGDSLGVQWLRLYNSAAGGRVPSLVRELDPTCHNWGVPHAAKETQHSQINKYFLKI